jgi:nucleotide-binding universal stress UspA family protein
MFHASLGVVSLVPAHPGRVAVDPWDDRDEHDRQLAEARALVAAQGLEAETFEPAGEPAPTIERIVAEGGYDTVILGSRGLNAAARFLQGSVSEHVATHAHATVVITR